MKFMKIKKNDIVKMKAGKDSGKTGKVLQSFPSEGKIMVEGLNIVKKHSKPRKQGEKGQRVEVPRKIPVSNAMLVCPKCAKISRIGYKIVDGKKQRICKKCQGEI
ncbi:MAG: 50S ribosomal protein L24 [Candidatus Moranbacteria bacterium RIFOXYA12_FULL_35_19]|nr:MAG: 50S ribosomal protein L24 [Candidatus Moranbacteria bacterium RIFOXYB12_FULL_35_8]OGI32816.1 MAG: 50S ribosomal protein L24 [Candidatus Moranbacteria bacterium RIFOXYC12_FULL_36_13]OGI36144.1 MAG: 50S ribosomal protein L24 [Candidatus Moranbacteria bacterium RIFOXYA12_FULL_35_19]